MFLRTRGKKIQSHILYLSSLMLLKLINGQNKLCLGVGYMHGAVGIYIGFNRKGKDKIMVRNQKIEA